MTTAESIYSAQGGKPKAGGGYMCHCPAHDDKNPSLSVDDGDNGRPLIKCWSGCTQESVINALKSRGVWLDDEMSLTPAELKAQRGEAERRKAVRIESELAKKAKAAIKARKILDGAVEDPAKHPYAIKKGVSLGDKVRRGLWPQRNWLDALLVPGYASDKRLSTVQAINIDGEKDFLSGGRITACFHPIGTISGASGLVVIGEGLATVAAVCEVMGCPGVVAFSAGNLEPVAREIRQLAPLADIALIADDDQKPGGHNPGEESAMYAAHAVGGKMAIPDLGKKADAWDVRRELGADGIKSMMAAAVKVRSTCGHLSKKPQEKKPEPLPDELLPVEPFNFALLPDSLRPWALDICERIQCPPDFVGVGIMVSLATVLGRKIGIRPQARTDWTVTPNLWGLVVGRPGVLKSPALDATLAPLNRLVLKANAEYDEAYTQYKAELALSKMQVDKVDP
jgi:putative DNA primase/helicase